MTERAGLRKEYTRHFLVDEARLRKIHNVLLEHARRLDEETYLRFYVERENNSFYETKAIEEVLSDDNAPGKTIRTVSLELHRVNPSEDERFKPEAERKPLAYVAFARSRDTKVVFFVAGDRRDWCFLLADELDTQIQRCLTHRNLAWLASRSLDIVVFFTLGALVLIWLIWLTSSPVPPEISSKEISTMPVDQATRKILEILSKKSVKVDYSGPILWLILAVVVAILELRPLSRLLGKTARSVFYWGDMVALQDRFEKRMTQLKWGIGVAFVVSVLGSIIATLVMR
jgi:hypothetical protein